MLGEQAVATLGPEDVAHAAGTDALAEAVDTNVCAGVHARRGDLVGWGVGGDQVMSGEQGVDLVVSDSLKIVNGEPTPPSTPPPRPSRPTPGVLHAVLLGDGRPAQEKRDLVHKPEDFIKAGATSTTASSTSTA